jgi:DNA-binding LacI/PurR family transcriptional regulator
MLIITAGQESKAEPDLIQDIIERGVEGLYADQLGDPKAALERLGHFGIHLALGQKPPGSLEADVVYADAEEGFRKVARRLQELGHKAAAIVSAECSPMAERRQIAKKVFSEMNFPHREVLVDSHEALANLDWLEASVDGGSRPTAAIALCGALAVGLLTNLISGDRRAPRDCSLLAAGPLTESFFESPKMAWLAWPTAERGRAAVARLIERAEAETQGGLPYLTTGLEAKFLQGETLGQAPARA